MLELYEMLYSGRPSPIMQVKTNPIEEAQQGLPIIEDAKKITLAQYDRVSKNAITAHNLSDYRRKSFNMLLLPKVQTWFELLLEGNEYYAEKLSVESPYS